MIVFVASLAQKARPPSAKRPSKSMLCHHRSGGDELKLQRCVAASPERERGNESGRNGDHAPDGVGCVRDGDDLARGFFHRIAEHVNLDVWGSSKIKTRG
jgi:hypothetical protein